MTNVMDNLEQIGHARSGSVTQIPAYTPDQEVGPLNDYSRDFHAKERVVGINTMPNVKEQLPPDERVISDATDLDIPATAIGTANDPTYVRESPADSFSTQQVTVGVGGAQNIVQEKNNRRSMVITNMDAANTVYVGSNSAVSVVSGYPLIKGATLTLNVGSEVWACVSTNAVTVGIIETLGSSE